MKICLVTAFPPSKRGLNEYGYHIARELQRDPLLSLPVLADELPSPEPDLDEFDVVRPLQGADHAIDPVAGIPVDPPNPQACRRSTTKSPTFRSRRSDRNAFVADRRRSGARRSSSKTSASA